MLRVLIVDDEPLARRRLDILLKAIPDVEVAGAAPDGSTARRCSASCAPTSCCSTSRCRA
jgi:chemotaxis response regulator CheB